MFTLDGTVGNRSSCCGTDMSDAGNSPVYMVLETNGQDEESDYSSRGVN